MNNPAFPISPEHFWQTFARKFTAEWKDATNPVRSYYNHGTHWTAFMTRFLSELGAEFGCHVDLEYRKIDVAYFDRSAAEWDEWAMEAVIEIENGMDWTNEISKLTLFNAGLKVLIAYDDTPGYVQKVLARFLEIHRSRKYHTANCGWLFVFGPRLIPTEADFKAFKSDGQTIQEITGDVRLLAQLESGTGS